MVEKVQVVNEKYFSITLDRKHQSPVLLASSEGGVNIEDIAARNPDAIKVLPIDINKGLNHHDAELFAEKMGYSGHLIKEAADVILKLFTTFVKKDCLMIEINPFATVRNEKGVEAIQIIDSKVTIDDNANFRQRDIEEIVDKSGKNELELDAESHGLNFIHLDGNIGCLVNGAGLAMATMDIIKLHGGNPANFLDVGGGASVDAMVHSLRILESDKQVESILVNIFGGILRCDNIAKAILTGTKQWGLKKKIVLRLKGTNADIAKKIIQESNLPNIEFCDDFDKSARLAVSGKLH